MANSGIQQHPSHYAAEKREASVGDVALHAWQWDDVVEDINGRHIVIVAGRWERGPGLSPRFARVVHLHFHWIFKGVNEAC